MNEGCADAGDITKIPRNPIHNQAGLKQCLPASSAFPRNPIHNHAGLNNAFLQIPLDVKSRKYTAFEFQSKAYQYKRIPYGFRNSLAGFMQTVLGDETCGYVINYLHDILIFSGSFDQHMDHLATVQNKLTSVRFTINARKCSFCKQEIKFLGHVVNREKLMPDPQQIEPILNYLAPRNQKQLRRFLGVCGFHRSFIHSFIHSFRSLSYDRSKASSKASSPHIAIQSFLLQMTVSFS